MNLAKTLEYLFSLCLTEDVILLDLAKQWKSTGVMYVIKVYCFMSLRGVVALASRGAVLKSVDPGPASSVSPGYLLELQLSITPDLLTQELRLGPENGFTRAPGDSEGCSSWRITAASESSSSQH